MVQLGVLILLAAMIGGIGLPAFIIHPVSIWSYIAARRAAANPDSSSKSDMALDCTVVTRNASSLVRILSAHLQVFYMRRRRCSAASLPIPRC